MPRCEGLPTGPCPLKVNNTTVKSTTLFLCPSCDEARFPKNPTAETKNSKGNKRTSGTKSVQTRSSNGNDENDSSDIDVYVHVASLPLLIGCLHDRANIEQLAQRSVVISMLIRRVGGL